MKRFLTALIVLTTGASAFAQMKSSVTYDVYALEYADAKGNVPVSRIALGATSTDSVNFAYYFWYLKGSNGKNILVDAGFREDSSMPRISLSYYERPDSVLAELGVPADSISDIILTHPHFDHIDGVPLFKNADVWMQRKDYDYFVGQAWQKGANRFGFTKEDVMGAVRLNLEGRMHLVDGDSIEIMPGIRAFIGSRHTWESQHLLVDTKDGRVMLASDDSWFYADLYNLLPIPVTFDKTGYVEQLARMKRLVADTTLIIPGHDSLVLTKFPKVARNIVRIK